MRDRDYEILHKIFLQLGTCIEGLVSQDPRTLEDFIDGAISFRIDRHGVEVLEAQDDQLIVPPEWGAA